MMELVEILLPHLSDVLDAYDRLIGLALQDIAVDGCITKVRISGRLEGAARAIGAAQRPG